MTAIAELKCVERIKQSPFNPLRWCCQLDCGHAEWISGKRKPTRKTLHCSRCSALRTGRQEAGMSERQQRDVVEDLHEWSADGLWIGAEKQKSILDRAAAEILSLREEVEGWKRRWQDEYHNSLTYGATHG